jgi:microcystin-dependent protein
MMKRNLFTFFLALCLSVSGLLADGNITVDAGDIGHTSAGFTLNGSALETAAYFRVEQTSTQSISGSTPTTVNYSTTDFDNLSGVDLADDYYEAQDAGYYLFTAASGISLSTSEKYADIKIKVNGTTVAQNRRPTPNGSATYVQITTLVQLSAGDKVAVVVEHDESVSKNTTGAAVTDYFEGYIIIGVRTGIPVGTVQAYAGSTIPGGWLDCDGSAVSRTTYANLFAAIGTTWGVGDGSTTFNLPDLRGSTVIGVGTGSGLTARALADTGGEEDHQLTIAELAAHNHTNGGHAYAGHTVAYGLNFATFDLSGQVTGTTGSSSAHNTMQPFAALYYMIKH